ncbi:unnamed protein product [Miscanthus lutarioriparius]|uniref:Uncharacterized protein n=1 Tax=Miscanthus lutarioriparius TaxID=422564 RepID=A0A811P144_9POAL|nr:unnamed protein product [Miscanthus lutarioriparius]
MAVGRETSSATLALRAPPREFRTPWPHDRVLPEQHERSGIPQLSSHGMWGSWGKGLTGGHSRWRLVGKDYVIDTDSVTFSQPSLPAATSLVKPNGTYPRSQYATVREPDDNSLGREMQLEYEFIGRFPENGSHVLSNSYPFNSSKSIQSIC